MLCKSNWDHAYIELKLAIEQAQGEQYLHRFTIRIFIFPLPGSGFARQMYSVLAWGPLQAN